MRSNFERVVASELMLAGIDYEYEAFELEYHQRIRSGYCSQCDGEEVYRVRKYTPDFWIPKHNVVIEAKGKFTAENRQKMLDVIKDWPDIDFRMYFMYNNKVEKKSKIRYSDWAEKHGVVYHCGTKEAPKWLKDLV